MYQKLSDEERATVGKFASNHGVASTTRKFKDYKLAKSTVRDWQNLYRRELAIKVEEAKREGKVGEEICVDVLPSKKQRKPPLLGVNLDCHLQEKILEMRSRGTPIGTSVVIGGNTDETQESYQQFLPTYQGIG